MTLPSKVITYAYIAVAHQSQEADVYKGYYFPSGTTFVPNVHGAFHDESKFSEPFRFNPERFLSENADFDPFSMGGFGYGRRTCPGRYVALSSSWLAISRMLAVFNILPTQDENGKAKVTPPEFISGLVVHPAPFEVIFNLRSEKFFEMIQEDNGNL
ncbi:hypothetical protein NP233_g1994 [Leucocoprinus birnbaumii]|uniref:Cytochrome P450 n=1 Tax=Leucocoprinus birnbaumii TaxID=56174 RepID=A0AAD5VZT1_9AGAR|nr:hypothetical protein NP233_g1994 [Leucocoprinus birnbaumii]